MDGTSPTLVPSHTDSDSPEEISLGFETLQAFLTPVSLAVGGADQIIEWSW